MSNTINLALAQLRCNLLQKQDNCRRIFACMESASRKQVDYILFPELYTTGSFLDERIVSLAEPLQGETVQTICQLAKRYNLGAIVGFPELYQSKLYNSAVFIDKNGQILGVYRKIHLFEFEKNVFSSGDDIPVFEVPEGKIGLMISYDIEFPEVARILAIKGVQLVLVLSANTFPKHPHRDVYLSARALENHVFVAAANKVGLEENTLFCGESKVVHPLGHTLYQCGQNEELAVVPIHLDEIAEARGALDYMANRRPAIYRKGGIGHVPASRK